MPDLKNQSLHQFLTGRYNLEGLKTLCLYLEVDYDNLDGRTKDSLARELIRYMARAGREGELIALQAARRDVPPERLNPLAHDPRRVFISHAHEDAPFAHQLAADLERDGIPVWIAPESIRPGEQWLTAIARGLQESGVCVVVLTPAGVASSWVEYETNLAINRERRGQMSLLLLDVADCDAPFGWTGFQFLPFRGSYAAGLAALRARLDGGAVETFQRNVSTPGRRIHPKTGIELIRIPAGPFLYGSSEADKMAIDNEKPQRTVDLPAYWIGRTPVTNAEFARFVAATGHRTTAEVEGKGIGWTGSKWDWIAGADWRHPSGPKTSIDGKDTHPVVQVSWHDAQAFCDWAGLALPAEEQWEKAARGTDGRIWPWGNSPPTTDHCNFGGNVGGTTPVGHYSPKGDSPYGCADMVGNVSEWTGSWYEVDKWRALRGGSWDGYVQYTRAAYRDINYPHNRNDYIGFRVVELLSDPGS